ncbi:Pyruvate dehydrogenase E1 component [Pandoraea capi]|uniref:Pyruvate dehydrogenase E1 component n=1 Tax=Pandoraea capi TaxID=2508286 RepID=A0ABY6VNF8_9BURK|nr:pyruvate dehydrogenase [Pandoraea capi]VVD68665.1 Pyruvate dehydrogenase E1 component [Pandoraea capi]
MMGMSGRGRSAVESATRQAALACIGKLMAFRDGGEREDGGGTATSPSGALAHIADVLAQGDTSEQVWIVDSATPAQETPGRKSRSKAASSSSLPSAIATWFRSATASERPLLYLLHSPTLRGVLMAGVEASGLRAPQQTDPLRRGIFLNDASVWSPDRLQRVRPELPLWLAAQSEWLPYDPASAQELQALLCAALDALYVRGEFGFCYLSAHDMPSIPSPALGPGDAHDAYRGMYRLRTLPDTNPPYVIRLCGAGRALANVLEAARWLQLDWGVACEVWSCPSYTRLAREAGEAERMSMLRADAPADVPHLVRCLGDGRAPVLAVTGYARHIANQIGAFIPARFAALGSDDTDVQGGKDENGESLKTGDAPGVRWIVLNALRLLVNDGMLPRSRIADATRRYGVI